MSFKRGTMVTVYNQTFSGKPIIEGRAEVLRSTGVDDQYIVQWQTPEGEAADQSARFVYGGECQADPESYIAKAMAEWQERQAA